MPKRLPAITIVRAYEIGSKKSAYRILVDRLWPRGLKKEDLQLDEWPSARTVGGISKTLSRRTAISPCERSKALDARGTPACGTSIRRT